MLLIKFVEIFSALTLFFGVTFPFFGDLLGFFGGFGFAPTSYFVRLSYPLSFSKLMSNYQILMNSI